MKAIVAEKYGPPDVLKFEEVQKPTPGDNDVLLKVQAASVNAGDWHLLRADPFIVRLMFGLLKPKIKILGADVAGRAEAVGKNVTQFQPGDELFGDLSGGSFGAFAEYVAVPEEALVLKPANIRGPVCAGWGVHGSTVPGPASGTVDVNDRVKKNDDVHQGNKQKGFAVYERAS